MSIDKQRGDTIIEVILASAMLALVTVSAFAIMQRASSSAYDAMERSAVRLQLNGQVELLTYFRDQYAETLVNGGSIVGTPAEVWDDITTQPNVATAPTTSTCSAPVNAFYLAKPTASDPYQMSTTITTAPGMPVPGAGLWIVKSPVAAGGPPSLKNYQQFYVVACWQTTISQEQRMSSVVRLYDPKP